MLYITTRQVVHNEKVIIAAINQLLQSPVSSFTTVKLKEPPGTPKF